MDSAPQLEEHGVPGDGAGGDGPDPPVRGKARGRMLEGNRSHPASKVSHDAS